MAGVSERHVDASPSVYHTLISSDRLRHPKKQPHGREISGTPRPAPRARGGAQEKLRALRLVLSLHPSHFKLTLIYEFTQEQQPILSTARLNCPASSTPHLNPLPLRGEGGVRGDGRRCHSTQIAWRWKAGAIVIGCGGVADFGTS
jgi:hypothetical protein